MNIKQKYYMIGVITTWIALYFSFLIEGKINFLDFLQVNVLGLSIFLFFVCLNEYLNLNLKKYPK